MLRRIALALVALLVVVVLGVAIFLGLAHRAIRRERAPLPTIAELSLHAADAGLPARLAFVDTASQPMPRSAVLDPGADPAPDARYVMSHPSFVLEWSDGRLLLVDLGMDREGALAFGAPLERLAGASPIEPHPAVAERLAGATSRVGAVVFTHLHSDHVGGVTALCAARAGVPFDVFLTDAQDARTNHTDRPGRELLRATPCVRARALGPGGGLVPLPGYPGVFVIAAGGHTPGSQLVVAFVRRGEAAQGFLFTGDIVNALDGALQDVAKPWAYRTFLVPEDDERQAELRRFLRAARDEAGLTLLVSHDALALEAAGLERWPTD